MRILIVAATVFEVQALLDRAGRSLSQNNPVKIPSPKHTVELLVTGVGPIFTTFELSRQLCAASYDLVVNIGICGAFSNEFEIGELLEITQDQFGDLGIDDNGSFRTLFEMGMMDESVPPFINGRLHSSSRYATGLRKASSITLSHTNGSSVRIESARQKFSADTESMEGAACFYTCRRLGIPCIQIRAVSNYVEPRDPNRWDIPLAIGKLNAYIASCLG